MKILCTRFPLESAYGGAENQTITLMEGLLARGHAVSFIGSCPALTQMCEERGIPNVRIDIGTPPVTKRGAISFFWRKRRMQKALKAILTEFPDIDAICMLSLTEKILLTPYAIQQGVRVLWIEHDTVGRWLTKNPSLPTLIKMSTNVTTVCVSDLSADIFRNLGYKNVVAIPNGVSFPSDDFTPHTFDETLRIGCIARLSEEKGVDILERAVRSLDNVTALIVGKGNVHIPTSPRVAVQSDIPDVNDVYSHIDVLVLPSRREDPFGLVVAEAMMRGIAVICTDVCGVSGYLQNGIDALIVPAGDMHALKDAIERMQETSFREQIANAGKHTAEQTFSLERMVDGYEKLLTVVQ